MPKKTGSEGAMNLHLRTHHRAGDEIGLFVGLGQQSIVREGFLQANQWGNGEVAGVNQRSGIPDYRTTSGVPDCRTTRGVPNCLTTNAVKNALRGGGSRGHGEEKDAAARKLTSAAGPKT